MKTVTSKDSTTIAYDQYGAGPAVILVGGAFQHRAIDPDTARLAEILAQQFTVFHYDRRGRGDSGDALQEQPGLGWETPYRVDCEVADLDALIQAAGGRASLFGMSSGGVLSLEAAARGLAVDKIALYEPPFNTQAAQRQETADYTRQLNALLAEGRREDAVAMSLASFGTPEEALAGMRQSPVWARFVSIAPTLRYESILLGDGFIPADRYAAITTPTLIIDGGASFDFMHDAAQALAAVLPHAKRLTLEGQTHAVAVEVLAPVLRSFFNA